MLKRLLIIFILFLNSELAAETKGTIVCIHGFLRTNRSMRPIGKNLEKNGFKVCLWDYPTRRKTIEEHAAQLVELLKDLAETEPGKPIHFVTHSLGGVIVRAAVNHPACPEEAKNGGAVLLAPPNQGSSLARCFQAFKPAHWLFGSKSGFQLLTFDSRQIARLGSFPETMKILVIAGCRGTPFFFNAPNDGKVSVEETRLDTAHEHISIAAGHSWIMSSRQSIELAKRFFHSLDFLHDDH